MKPLRPALVLTMFYALVGFVSGCGLAQFRLPGYESMGAFANVLLLNMATFAWFRNDASQQSYPRSAVLNVGVVGLSLLALPYYLLKSRGLKRGVMAIGLGVSIFLLSGVAEILGILFTRRL